MQKWWQDENSKGIEIINTPKEQLKYIRKKQIRTNKDNTTRTIK